MLSLFGCFYKCMILLCKVGGERFWSGAPILPGKALKYRFVSFIACADGV